MSKKVQTYDHFKEVLKYNLWGILFDNDDESNMSKWACKYSIANSTSEVKSYISHSTHAYLYCFLFDRDVEIEELITGEEDKNLYKKLIEGIHLSQKESIKFIVDKSIIFSEKL